MSAVSNSVMPRSSARWITLREPSRSTRWPKLLQPRPTAETRKPEPPRLRICIDFSPLGEDERNDALCRAHPHPARRGPATLLQLQSAQARFTGKNIRKINNYLKKCVLGSVPGNHPAAQE